jgi:hypothetical protein
VKNEQGSTGAVITVLYVTKGTWTYSIIPEATATITPDGVSAVPLDGTVASLPAAGGVIEVTSAGLKELIASEGATITATSDYAGGQLMFSKVNNSGTNPTIYVYNTGDGTGNGKITVTVTLTTGLFDNGESTKEFEATITAKAAGSLAVTVGDNYSLDMGDISIDANTTVTKNGAGTLTIGNVSATSADLTLAGTGAIVVGDVAVTTSGDVKVTSTGTVTIGDITGDGDVEVSAAATVTTGDIDGDLTIILGTVATGEVTGTISVGPGTYKVLDGQDITLTGAATLDLTGLATGEDTGDITTPSSATVVTLVLATQTTAYAFSNASISAGSSETISAGSSPALYTYSVAMTTDAAGLSAATLTGATVTTGGTTGTMVISLAIS